jgi:hypothetical protein
LLNSSKRILIISPSLEPNQCGVSDYTNVLNKFLYEDKFVTFRITLNDHYCKEISEHKHVIRINKSQPISTKTNVLQNINKQFDPELILLNYVSYGYHKYGLPFFLMRMIKKTFYNKTIILIFHELWPGNLSSDSFKDKLIGFVHRLFIKRMVKIISPNKIIVNAEIWQKLLNEINIKSCLVPVFSNIDVIDYNLDKSSVNNQFNESIDINKIIAIAVFGSSGFSYDTSQIIHFFSEQIKNTETIFHFICIGKNQPLFDVFKKLHHVYPERILIEITGVLSAEKVSELFHYADYGLTSYMPQFWSKSGAIAAMLAHRLTVLSISNSFSEKSTISSVHLPESMLSIQQLSNGYKFVNKSSLPKTNYNLLLYKDILEIINS